MTRNCHESLVLVYLQETNFSTRTHKLSAKNWTQTPTRWGAFDVSASEECLDNPSSHRVSLPAWDIFEVVDINSNPAVSFKQYSNAGIPTFFKSSLGDFKVGKKLWLIRPNTFAILGGERGALLNLPG